MCLYSKNRLPRIAWKPIKVYKLVQFENNNYYTPYYSYRFKHKNSINIFDTLLNIIFNIKKERDHIYEITTGFFHSFFNKTNVLNRQSGLCIYGDYNDYTLIECTIPKFSLYYKGESGEICSNRLNTEFKKYNTNRFE